jgi:hypothetical protein
MREERASARAACAAEGVRASSARREGGGSARASALRGAAEAPTRPMHIPPICMAEVSV